MGGGVGGEKREEKRSFGVVRLQKKGENQIQVATQSPLFQVAKPICSTKFLFPASSTLSMGCVQLCMIGLAQT